VSTTTTTTTTSSTTTRSRARHRVRGSWHGRDCNDRRKVIERRWNAVCRVRGSSDVLALTEVSARVQTHGLTKVPHSHRPLVSRREHQARLVRIEAAARGCRLAREDKLWTRRLSGVPHAQHTARRDTLGGMTSVRRRGPNGRMLWESRAVRDEKKVRFRSSELGCVDCPLGEDGQ
jgi:hypothetical protein